MRPHIQCTALSILPEPDASTEGILMEVAPDAQHALDAREKGYDLVAVGPEEGSIFTYVSAASQPGEAQFPILQSYLDVVLSGFEEVFGPGSADSFIETTTGWETPVLRDRHAPLYPRAQKLKASRLAEFDHALTRFGVTCVDLPNSD